jgi:hypothetical protein
LAAVAAQFVEVVGEFLFGLQVSQTSLHPFISILRCGNAVLQL